MPSSCRAALSYCGRDGYSYHIDYNGVPSPLRRFRGSRREFKEIVFVFMQERTVGVGKTELTRGRNAPLIVLN